MKNKKGVIVKRQQTILQRLQKEKEVSVDQLANELGVSPLTIRRDLIEFENQGFVKRHYGGAKLIEGTLLKIRRWMSRLPPVRTERRITEESLQRRLQN